jgi:hypothetical protein
MVIFKCAEEFTGVGVPNSDRAVSGTRDDEDARDGDGVDSCSMGAEYKARL